MAADLFETYAVTAVAVMLLGIGFEQNSSVYPLALGGISIIASVISTFFTRVGGGPNAIINALYRSVLVATVLSALRFIGHDGVRRRGLQLLEPVRVGPHRPRRDVPPRGDDHRVLHGHPLEPREADREGVADGARHEHHRGARGPGWATALPVVVIASSIVGAYCAAGESLYGIGVAVMAQLSMTGLPHRALDAYGPVTDQAGGIAEMADLQVVAGSPTRWTR